MGEAREGDISSRGHRMSKFIQEEKQACLEGGAQGGVTGGEQDRISELIGETRVPSIAQWFLMGSP